MFDDVRLPENIEVNAKGGPTFKTTILVLGNGREVRNREWSRQRNAYDIGYGVQEYDDYIQILSFFYARAGRAIGFRFKDWLDYSAEPQTIATGDGTTVSFQLTKTYADTVRPYVRKITRPVPGTLTVYVNGGSVPYTEALGVITLSSAPAIGAIITAGFEFDVPVRFDSDASDFELPTDNVATLSSIKLMELIE